MQHQQHQQHDQHDELHGLTADMNTDRNLSELAREIEQLESDAFEITDCNDPAEMLIVSTNSTSCLCSTTSSTCSG